MLKLLAKLLKALNSEAEPGQIAAAMVMGMIMGLTPLLSLHNLLILLLALLLRVNLSAFIVSLVVFSGLAYALDPLADWLGQYLLYLPVLQDIWTGLYQSGFWRALHFNHTITLGSLLIALVLAAPLFVVLRILIRQYRAHLLAWVRRSRLMQMLQASRFYRIYISLTD